MNQREKNYDYLRSISCIAVVLLHVSSSYWSVVNTDSTDFVIMTIYNGITRFAVPVFMMLSGAFMLEPKSEENISCCLTRFAKYVLNFYLWSAFYALQGIAVKIVTGKEVTGDLWSNSLDRFFWGHYHMWFIYLILGFYLLVPIVRKLTESKLLIEYYLILWVVTRYLIPSFSSIGVIGMLNTWIYKLDLNMVIGYLGYFILGYYIRKYGFAQKVRIFIYVGGVIGLVYSVTETIIQSRMQNVCVESYFSPSSWNVLLLAMATFTLFTYMKKVDKSYWIISRVAKYSFIIYMIHPFFLEKLNLIGVTTISFNCLWSVPILTIIIFVCSFGIAHIIKHIPFINKLLI